MSLHTTHILLLDKLSILQATISCSNSAIRRRPAEAWNISMTAEGQDRADLIGSGPIGPGGGDTLGTS